MREGLHEWSPCRAWNGKSSGSAALHWALRKLMPDRGFGRIFLILAFLGIVISPASALTESKPEAFRFFEGETERVSTVKVLMKGTYRSKTLSHGRILPDGSLSLVQEVSDEGKPLVVRRWTIRQVSATRYTGSMSDAVAPGEVERIGDRYRFRLKLKGNLAVEEWLTPFPDGLSAKTQTIVHKWGIRVATGEGVIRRV